MINQFNLNRNSSLNFVLSIISQILIVISYIIANKLFQTFDIPISLFVFLNLLIFKIYHFVFNLFSNSNKNEEMNNNNNNNSIAIISRTNEREGEKESNLNIYYSNDRKMNIYVNTETGILLYLQYLFFFSSIKYTNIMITILSMFIGVGVSNAFKLIFNTNISTRRSSTMKFVGSLFIISSFFVIFILLNSTQFAQKINNPILHHHQLLHYLGNTIESTTKMMNILFFSVPIGVASPLILYLSSLTSMMIDLNSSKFVPKSSSISTVLLISLTVSFPFAIWQVFFCGSFGFLRSFLFWILLVFYIIISVLVRFLGFMNTIYISNKFAGLTFYLMYIITFVSVLISRFFDVSVNDISLKSTFFLFFLVLVGMILIDFSNINTRPTSSVYTTVEYLNQEEMVQSHGNEVKFIIFNKDKMTATLHSLFKEIFNSKESRSLFLFFSINFIFMFFEFAYGIMTNSLGLISDAFHMLFDCTSLIIGLVASIISRWESNDKFPFGYQRTQIISGFSNSCLLIFISVFVFFEAIERTLNPPVIYTDHLILISVLGFFVNILGIILFSDTSTTAITESGLENSSLSLDEENLNSLGNGVPKKNPNLQGVFFHIIADTLGSVAVIISSLLVHFYNWVIMDSICSMILSCTIFLSVFGLFKNTLRTLLDQTPDISTFINQVIPKIESIPQVESVKNFHFNHVSESLLSASLSVVTVFQDRIPNSHLILQQIKQILFDSQIVHPNNVSIQLETQKSI